MESVDIDNPSWEYVETAVRALNAADRNDIYLQPLASNNETYLGIGGGGGRYLVTGAENNTRFPTVVNSTDKQGANVELMIGGQIGDYPANWILDLTLAIRAAESFYASGQFGGGDLIWIDA